MFGDSSTARNWLLPCAPPWRFSPAALGTDSSGTFFGPSQRLGNGTVKTYTALDRDGHPTELGLRLTATALDGLPRLTLAARTC